MISSADSLDIEVFTGKALFGFVSQKLVIKLAVSDASVTPQIYLAFVGWVEIDRPNREGDSLFHYVHRYIWILDRTQ